MIIKDACSRELLDLGLSFNSLNIKAVLSEVAEARRRESAARAKADADVVQAQEEQRARIAQLEAAQKINDQERALNMQIASNGAEIANAEARSRRWSASSARPSSDANQITQARADAEQNVIQQEAEGRAQAARIRAVAEAEADAIRMKAQALMEAGERLPRSPPPGAGPALTRAGRRGARRTASSSTSARAGAAASTAPWPRARTTCLRVVQTLMAAQVITASGGGDALGPARMQEGARRRGTATVGTRKAF